MRPLPHLFIVNGRTGDPALFVETLFEKGAIMSALGDLSNLAPRKTCVSHIFVSCAHIDHLFDHFFAGALAAIIGAPRGCRSGGAAEL
jgi:ribonuclease Z